MDAQTPSQSSQPPVSDSGSSSNPPQTPSSPPPPSSNPPSAPQPPSSGSSTPESPSSSNPTPPSSPPPAETPPVTPPAAQPKKFSLLLIIIILFCIGGLFLTLWYFFTQTQQNNSSTQVAPTNAMVKPAKLVIGTDPTYPPMEFTEDKALKGYDIDLGNFLAKELGAQIEYKQIVFDDLFTALEKKEIDLIISTVTVTEERKQKYDFSDPYLNAGQVILTRKDNNSIKSTADLKGKKVAVQKGTTIESEALKYTSDNLVIRFPDFVQATKALVDGQVDAIFADLPGAKGITNDNPTLKIASDPFTNEYYAVVFRKGDSSIKEINEALSSLRVKGILTDLKQKWLD